MKTFGDPGGNISQKAVVKLMKCSSVKLADLSKVEEKLRGLLI